MAVLARGMHQTAARIHAEKDLAMARDAAQAANALEGDKARDLGAGMDGHVSKPIAADAPRHGIKGLLSEELPRKLAAGWPLDGRGEGRQAAQALK